MTVMYSTLTMTLAASAARVASGNGTSVFVGGERKRFIVTSHTFSVTAYAI